MKSLFFILAASLSAHAGTIFFDTTPLQALGGTWYFDFQLANGDAGVNSVVISNITLAGGGSHQGTDALTGGGSGTFPNYTLSDSSFFNQALVGFAAGTNVQFDLTYTGNYTNSGTPDTFTWAVLDSSFNSIVSSGLGAGLVVLLDGGSGINTYAADASYNFITPQLVGAVPEPAESLLIGGGLLAMAACRIALRRRGLA